MKVKIGLEIHRQLNSKEKLFCNCSTESMGKVMLKFFRYLHPVYGEMGEKDAAAQHEFLKGRKFVYNVYDNNCLVEMDEEPPHEMNKEALRIALQCSIMLNCEIPDELHIMRKTVIDGSNTSGFQRTCLVGMNGYIETSKGKVRIKDVNLEEDSCGLDGIEGNEVVYSMDRLGIPLVEIGTYADILNGKHCKETALKIGRLLRSLNVKRGIGTIRQDVNISVEKGARVEIKGFQDVRKIDKLVDYEIERQKNLIKIKEELNKKGIKEIKISERRVNEIFRNCGLNFLKNYASNGLILAFKIEKLRGYFKRNISGKRTLGKEMADYLKAFGIKGYIHSDEDLEKYGIVKEFEKLREILNAGKEDLVLIIAIKEEERNKIREFLERIKLLPVKIPEETRKVNADCTTSYLRPLPGRARMYPETDLPPIRMDRKFLNELRKNLPESIENKLRKLEREIGKELANQLIDSEFIDYYEKLKDKFDRKILANLLTNIFGKLEGEGFDVKKIDIGDIEELMNLYEKGKIVRSSFEFILKEIIRGEKIHKVIEKNNLWKLKKEEMREIIENLRKNLKGKIDSEEKLKKIILSEIMKKYRERIDGEEVKDILGI